MKAMYSVYDRNGDCFDFCDDEETEHSLNYEAEHDRLRVWQWSADRSRWRTITNCADTTLY
jgi:hypothetical protein